MASRLVCSHLPPPPCPSPRRRLRDCLPDNGASSSGSTRLRNAVTALVGVPELDYSSLQATVGAPAGGLAHGPKATVLLMCALVPTANADWASNPWKAVAALFG